ncbi:ribosomal subunit 39S-domain-containing protein [Xylariaceae sp. FL0662B]|nr:ribosomal subunit 39S-domain-containing protein [Xylariaceae sp. FL0662B]
MRRTPRLRRLSRLSPSTSTPRCPIAPLGAQHPAASSQPVFPSQRRPTPVNLQCPSLARFYSPRRNSLPASLGGSPAEYDNVDEANELNEYQPSDTYIPPPRYSRAPRPDRIRASDYVPADISKGLETVGGIENWWNREHWSDAGDFVGFKPREKLLDPTVIEASVRRAVVEAYMLKQAGRERFLTKNWPVGGEEELHRVMDVGITTAEGAVSVGEAPGILDALSKKDEPQSAAKPVLSPEEAVKYKEAWDSSWKKAPLSDPRIKFAVTKRVFQLTGHLVPDYQLSSITNVYSLLRIVQKPPKPKTLTQEIQIRHQELVQLPNVSVASKRLTRGDKEKAVGRFKLIEEEYRKRGLPLVGHDFVRKNRELWHRSGGT